MKKLLIMAGGNFVCGDSIGTAPRWQPSADDGERTGGNARQGVEPDRRSGKESDGTL